LGHFASRKHPTQSWLKTTCTPAKWHDVNSRILNVQTQSQTRASKWF